MCEFLSIGLFMSHYWYNLVMLMTCTQTDKIHVYQNKHTLIKCMFTRTNILLLEVH